MRPVLYASIAGLLTLLAGLGVREAAEFKSDNALLQRDAAREQLERVVDAFQDERLADVRGLLRDLADPDAVRVPQADLRRRIPWFDAAYVWEGSEMSVPVLPPEDDLQVLRADPCIRAAGRVAAGPDRVAGGTAYMRCLRRPPEVALFAVSEAVELFFSADRVDLVTSALRAVQAVAGMSLGETALYDVSPRRVLILRLDMIRLALQAGDDDVAESRYARTAAEILRQDAPVLDQVLDLYSYPIASDLRNLRHLPVDEEDEGLARALRRVAAWKEIGARSWSPGDPGFPSEVMEPRYLSGPSDGPPWLVVYAKLGVGNVLGGVQIDQPAMLAMFMRSLKGPLKSAISVRTNGRVLLGSTDPLLVHTTFSVLWPQVTVGLTEDAVPDSGATRRLLVQLIPVGLGVVVGTAALLAMVGSDREQVRLLERQREFMTRVTHELKTPLSGVRLMAENLEMGAYSSHEDVASFAGRIVTETDRLAARLDDIIKAASGPAREDPSEFDGDALVAEVADRWRPLFEQHEATLVVDVPRPVGTMRARRGIVRDALVNLLDNALKYRHADRPLEVTLRVTGDRRHVTFEVVDNGIGVPPALRKVIFERFRRVEGPGRGKAGGHGLGLSFVAEAAQAHGGRVECRDGAAGGTRFILRIRRKN
jgi:signal transduction histidine kinase